MEQEREGNLDRLDRWIRRALAADSDGLRPPEHVWRRVVCRAISEQAGSSPGLKGRDGRMARDDGCWQY
jgi:hypothetical protein